MLNSSDPQNKIFSAGGGEGCGMDETDKSRAPQGRHCILGLLKEPGRALGKLEQPSLRCDCRVVKLESTIYTGDDAKQVDADGRDILLECRASWRSGSARMIAEVVAGRYLAGAARN